MKRKLLSSLYRITNNIDIEKRYIGIIHKTKNYTVLLTK